MPEAATGEQKVQATSIPDGATAQQLWDWLTAEGGIGLEGGQQYAWLILAVPHWALKFTVGTADVKVTAGLTADAEVTRGDD